MNVNYNERGAKYEMHSKAEVDYVVQLLNKNASLVYNKINNKVMSRYKHDTDVKKATESVFSIMECYRSFMFQALRMKIHEDNLYKNIPDDESMMVMSSFEASTDFESLLYHARSALDRMTTFLATKYHQKTDKINKLLPVLANFEHNDIEAKKTLEVLRRAIPLIQGLLINAPDNSTSLRSSLAHRNSHTDLVNTYFTIHRTESKILRFDQEFNGYPMLISSNKLIQYVSYIILNTVNFYLGKRTHLNISECKPTWNARCIHATEYISNNPEDSIAFTFPMLTPTSVKLNTLFLHKSVFIEAENC